MPKIGIWTDINEKNRKKTFYTTLKVAKNVLLCWGQQVIPNKVRSPYKGMKESIAASDAKHCFL